MNFLQFAVWGSYLTCIGNFLGRVGLGDEISWFYVAQGIVSIFMPAIVGAIADKFVQPQRMLGISHLLAAAFMIVTAWFGIEATDLAAIQTAEQIAAGVDPEKVVIVGNVWPIFIPYLFSVAFYMPTLALSNTVAFSILSRHGFDTVKDFPPIRVFGTIGFIAAMWFVNFAKFGMEMSFQFTYMQLVTSGLLGILLAIYSFTLPSCPLVKGDAQSKKSLVQRLGLDAFVLFKQKKMALFFIFSMLLGVSLQITNGFANSFITSFKNIPEFANTFGANHANALISLSQVSETLCILLIPFFLKRFGIKRVMLIAMFAWVLRFGLFGLGDPGSGLWMFILSMIVYGVAFDFFNISGSLFVNENTSGDMRSSAQGLFMIMTNGIGATIGTLGAQAIVNHFVPATESIDGVVVNGISVVEGWSTTWLVFAGYALVVALLFMVLFRYKHDRNRQMDINH